MAKLESYSFVTVWKVDAPVDKVWNELIDSNEWPLWWKGVKEVKVLRKGDENGKGSITFYEMGTFFYTLKFMMKVVEVEKHRYIHGVAEGDLIGMGLWEFTEENGAVIVKYYWEVETTIPWMNKWAWLLRPVFKLSHHLVMWWGGRGLKRRLKSARE